jgi:hypothetical protein
MRRVFFIALCFVSIAANAASWKRYPEHGCIGGAECRQNGKRITIALDSAPVVGVRFFAHDNIGQRADGKLTVRIDGQTIASYIDVQRNGHVHEFDVDRVRGDRLVIETANDDEVEIRDIEVLYGNDYGRDRDRDRYNDRGRDNDRNDRWDRDLGEEGGCIGGDECGGRRSRIRIPLRDRPVRDITFFAHDAVGNRSSGKLRVRIDDRILRDYVDIERRGRDYSFDGLGLRGRYVIIEPAADDEVDVKDIRIRYGKY